VKEGFEATQIWSLNTVKMANGTRPSECFVLKNQYRGDLEALDMERLQLELHDLFV
jgi:hypothetical protein